MEITGEISVSIFLHTHPSLSVVRTASVIDFWFPKSYTPIPSHFLPISIEFLSSHGVYLAKEMDKILWAALERFFSSQIEDRGMKRDLFPVPQHCPSSFLSLNTSVWGSEGMELLQPLCDYEKKVKCFCTDTNAEPQRHGATKQNPEQPPDEKPLF